MSEFDDWADQFDHDSDLWKDMSREMIFYSGMEAERERHDLHKQADALGRFRLDVQLITGGDTAQAAKDAGLDPDSFIKGIESVLEHAIYTEDLWRKQAGEVERRDQNCPKR